MGNVDAGLVGILSAGQHINRVKGDLEQLAPAARAETEHAVEIVRAHRTVMLGMPRTHPALTGPSTERIA